MCFAMAQKQRVKTFQETGSGLRCVVDLQTGIAFITDGKDTNIIGKFDRRGTKVLLGPLSQVGK